MDKKDTQVHHIEEVEKGIDDARLLSTIEDATRQMQAEHEMTLWQGIKEYKGALWWSFVISLCVVMDGYDNTLMGSFFAFPQFNEHYGELVNGEWVISASWQTALSALSGVGSIIGILVSGQLTERFGHRKVILGALAFICGAIFAYFFAPSKGVLVVGVILTGMPIGIFSTIAPTYASEVCPVVLRGYMTTYINACWAIGQLISQGVLRGCLNIDSQWSYRIPFAIQWAWPVPIAVLVLFAPDSPWWLVRKERLDKATKMIRRLSRQTEEEAARTVAMMVHTNELEKKVQEGATYLDCFKGTDLRRTEISSIVFLIQAVSMGNTMSYSSYFFQMAGLPPDQSFNMSIGQYCMGIVGIICSWFLMTHVGRRRIYVCGLFSIAILFLIMGFVSLAPESNSGASWATAALLLIIVFAYDMTLGPVCYSLISEMSSTRLRAKTISIARNTFNVWSIVNGIIYPYIMNNTAGNWRGKVGFFQFGLCTVCFTWAFFRLPEPKGRTYEELDLMFLKRLPARKFKGYVVNLEEDEGELEIVH
uniref:ARAD1D35728p n=1 Tax=Blastobotrys adeninivorans TaxID=409370 RepID=A0A060TBJ9_BLAAD